MIVLDRIVDVRKHCDEARQAGGSVGLVPTMGFLHDGHLELMRRARQAHDLVVVSVFVNPTQFAPGEDLDAYPRDSTHDFTAAEAAGVDVLFVPSVSEMYPDAPPSTTVHVAGLTEGLCGASRPSHFDGVATVCTKLFSIVGPCSAYFGQKDFQQLQVVRQLVADLDLPVAVVGCPTTRESDGLAMSSRNAYLSPDERAVATIVVETLQRAVDVVRAGQRDVAQVRAAAVAVVQQEPRAELDYVEVVRADDLQPTSIIADGVKMLVALAVRIGRARLIDNTIVVVDRSSVTSDLDTFLKES